jgi:predicted transcriptional regulator
MIIKLTEEQLQALERGDGVVPVEDSETHRRYFLVEESTFKSLQQQEDLAAIRSGIEDMEAGRVLTLDELDSRIRARLAG